MLWILLIIKASGGVEGAIIDLYVDKVSVVW